MGESLFSRSSLTLVSCDLTAQFATSSGEVVDVDGTPVNSNGLANAVTSAISGLGLGATASSLAYGEERARRLHNTITGIRTQERRNTGYSCSSEI